MTRYLCFVLILAAAMLAGCAGTPVEPGLLDNARFAIGQAEDAGAPEYSPLELRQARTRLSAAITAIEERDGDQARRLADESEILAQLALARTRAALSRDSLDSARADLERLERDLVDSFGETVLEIQ